MSITQPPPSVTDYSKFTVPQLKAACKELNITGYSKLGKAALLERLSQNGGRVSQATKEAVRSATKPTKTLGRKDKKLSTNGLQTPDFIISSSNNTMEGGQRLQENITPQKTAHTNQISRAPSTAVEVQHSISANISPRSADVDAVIPIPTLSKRKVNPNDSSVSSDSPNSESNNKRIKPLNVLNQNRKKTSVRSSSNSFKALVPVPKNVNAVDTTWSIKTPQVQVSSITVGPSKLSTQSYKLVANLSSVQSKRFVPLRTVKRTALSQGNLSSTHSVYSSEEIISFAAPLHALPLLNAIDMPPSLSQRKRVHAWSVILSGLSDAERRQCSLVSRMFRYAVYLSANQIMSRTFSGTRLSRLYRRYNPTMTNYWPLLRDLQEQKTKMKYMYKRTFLAQYFGKHMPIAERLWYCPDHERQLTIAIRFLMTRVWLAIMVPLNKNEHGALLCSVVINAQEVIKDEMWSVTVMRTDSISSNKHEEVYYVLEPTCEVVGRPAEEKLSGSFNQKIPTKSENSSIRTLAMRVDWTSYVENRLMPAGFHDMVPPSLLGYLKWTNAEEYKQGISRHWLSRIDKEGELGAYKKKVAQRYILACVVNNSVSGEWMSSSSMAQAFSGSVPVTGAELAPRKKQNPKVNLFLPAHHLVESVHFATSKGQPLHPALASIQTPGREYLILRDNGMEVGCEEDGIWSPWTELLCCDEKGLALQAT